MGTLYLVGTPIGNLGDLSPRAAKTLEEVDFIAAEDTRVTVKLLNHLGIKKPMISYYEHNVRERSDQIIGRLLAGESCAIVTDAGMPCISDPGEVLVDLCHRQGIPVAAVPGPSAVVTALAASGLATSRFAFEGFLTMNKTGRRTHLESLREDTHTLIFYEAPHKLLSTLTDMLRILGDRNLAICRELTKLHEEIIRTSLAEAVEFYTQNNPRGEFVLVLEGAPPAKKEEVPFDEAVAMTAALIAGGESPTLAAKQVSRQTGHKKGDLYKAAIRPEE